MSEDENQEAPPEPERDVIPPEIVFVQDHKVPPVGDKLERLNEKNDN